MNSMSRMTYFKVLPGGVKNLDHIGVAKKPVKRLQRQVLGQWIDQNRVVVCIPGNGKLHQAQLGIIGTFPQKLGIDGDIGRACRLAAKGLQARGRCNRYHTLGWPFVFIPNVAP